MLLYSFAFSRKSRSSHQHLAYFVEAYVLMTPTRNMTEATQLATESVQAISVKLPLDYVCMVGAKLQR